jgi:hypothetical protein
VSDGLAVCRIELEQSPDRRGDVALASRHRCWDRIIDSIDLLKSSEKRGLARFVRSDYRNQPVGDKKRVCVLEPSDSFELDLQ